MVQTEVAMVIQIAGAAMFGFMMAGINNFIETHNPRDQEIKKRMGEVSEWSLLQEIFLPRPSCRLLEIGPLWHETVFESGKEATSVSNMLKNMFEAVLS